MHLYLGIKVNSFIVVNLYIYVLMLYIAHFIVKYIYSVHVEQNNVYIYFLLKKITI